MAITSAKDTYAKLRLAAQALNGSEPVPPSTIVNGPKCKMPEYSPSAMNQIDSSTKSNIVIT